MNSLSRYGPEVENLAIKVSELSERQLAGFLSILGMLIERRHGPNLEQALDIAAFDLEFYGVQLVDQLAKRAK